LVSALILLMNTDGIDGPVNLGNPREFTIKQLADEVILLSGSASVVEHLPLPQDDPKQRQPNISRAQALFNWTPQIELREGLQKTIAYFKGQINREPTADSEQPTAAVHSS